MGNCTDTSPIRVNKNHAIYLTAATLIILIASCSTSENVTAPTIVDAPQFEVRFDPQSSALWVTVHPVIPADAQLYTRVRRGPVVVLDCQSMLTDSDMKRIDGNPIVGMGRGSAFNGPQINPNTMFINVEDISWVEGEPTLEQIEAATNAQHTIDLCLVSGNEIFARQKHAACSTEVVQANSTIMVKKKLSNRVAYEKCLEELGPIPFFPEIGEGDYETYSCLDSTPIQWK